MTDVRVHRAGDRYVIDADDAGFAALCGLVRGNHLVRETGQVDAPAWLVGLRAVFDAVAKQLPRGPSYSSLGELIDAGEIEGVDFVSTSTRVLVGVDPQVLRRLADCLELAVIRGDDRELHPLIGAWFEEIRTMFLMVSSALGRIKHAREVAFGAANQDR